MPDKKFVPPSDAVEVKQKIKFVPPSDAVEVKKKEPTDGTGQPSQKASSTRTDRSKPLSATEKPQGQKVSDGLGGGSDGFTTNLSIIDRNLISKEEEDVVPLLRSKFQRYGFTFDESGAGDAMIVRNSKGESIEVDLDPWTTSSEEEGAIKLKKFLSSSRSIDVTERASKLFQKPKLTKEEEEKIKKLTSYSSALDNNFINDFNQKNNTSNYTEKAKKDIDEELGRVGFFNGVKSGLSDVYNSFVGVVGKMTDLTKEEIEEIKIDKNPISKQIQEVKSDPKNSKLSDEQIKEIAYEKAIKERADAYKDSEVKSYLSGLDEESKQILQADKIIEQATIDDKIKEKQIKHSALLKSAENDAKKYLEAVKTFGQDSEEALSLKESVESKISEIEGLQSSIYSDSEKVGSIEDELDLLKRNYGAFENFTGRWTSAAGSALGGMLKMANRYSLSTPGVKIGNDALINELIDNSESINEKLRRPISNVNNVSDFADYWSDLIATQAPNLIQNAAFGYGSLPFMGMSAAGQKAREMEKEVLAGDKKYTPDQMMFAPLLYGSAEVVSEIPTVGIIKKLSRVNKAIQADDAARRELYSTIFDRINKLSKGSIKDQSSEIAGESLTNVMQNAVDKYLLNKKDVGIFDNSLDVIKDTVLLTSTLQAAPHVFGAITKPFTKPDYIKVLDENSKKIAKLSNEINNPNISKEAKDLIQSKIEKITSDSGSIINQVISTIEGLPDSAKNQIASIEKKQSELRAKADSVIKDKTIDVETKKQLLEDLKSEFKQIEDDRIKILNGEEIKEVTGRPEEVVDDEIANLNDNELITFTVKTLDEVPEQFRDRAKKVGGQGIETRKLILGLPLGKKETVKPYVYSITGKEAKEFAKQQQQSAGQTPVQPTTKVGETIENVEDKNKSLEKIHNNSVLHGTDDGYRVKQSGKSYETAKDIRTQVAKLTKGNLGEIVEFKTDNEDGTILYNVAVAVNDSKRGGGNGFIAYSVKVEKESNLPDSEIYSVLRKNLDGVFEQGLVNNQGIISKGVNLNQINKKTFEPTKQQQKPEAKNSLSLFQEISEMTNKSQMQEFSQQNPDVAFIHNNIEGIIKGIDGAKVVEC